MSQELLHLRTARALWSWGGNDGKAGKETPLETPFLSHPWILVRGCPGTASFLRGIGLKERKTLFLSFLHYLMVGGQYTEVLWVIWYSLSLGLHQSDAHTLVIELLHRSWQEANLLWPFAGAYKLSFLILETLNLFWVIWSHELTVSAHIVSAVNYVNSTERCWAGCPNHSKPCLLLQWLERESCAGRAPSNTCEVPTTNKVGSK